MPYLDPKKLPDNQTRDFLGRQTHKCNRDPVFLAAFFAAELLLKLENVSITKDLDEVARAVMPCDPAVRTLYPHKLPDLMGLGKARDLLFSVGV
ncbi:hypothetical protein [Rhizobium oryzicola]|uniref:Uncharacterized protein n=1 Tax=Rhizobium oryzicola TaxID=1232668 RepID=A0ABT8SVK9_9HYPH|nr:hypothetical protein [Rhizobium oryzicola]MDO1582447.1 hypothetical protein [Rhizobium oryzicola]